MKKLVIIAHDIRSSHNIGSILRTGAGFNIHHIYLTGYSPYPSQKDDKRLKHLADRIDRRIKKTSLGAEGMIGWSHWEDVASLIKKLKDEGYLIAALEQTKAARDIRFFKPEDKLALVLGSEIGGVGQPLLNQCDIHLKIPMPGQKDSFNVAVSAAIAIYQLSA